VAELLRAGRSAQRILIQQGTSMNGPAGEIRRRAEAAGIPVRMAPAPQLDGVAPGINHQGVVAVTGRYRYVPLPSILEISDPRVLFLDGITDPHNLGSLLRSAEVAGFTGVVVPTHRSAGVNVTVRRISAGAAELVSVARVSNLGRAMEESKEAGLWLVGLDADGEESLWDSDLLEPPVGLVLGSEGKGLSRGVRTHCDALVRIPMSGHLGSLNVGVAGAVAMFEVARRLDGSTAHSGREHPNFGGESDPRGL
jgi:23S rRNA (guanosine2251-2'-O)-methyltransferase